MKASDQMSVNTVKHQGLQDAGLLRDGRQESGRQEGRNWRPKPHGVEIPEHTYAMGAPAVPWTGGVLLVPVPTGDTLGPVDGAVARAELAG